MVLTGLLMMWPIAGAGVEPLPEEPFCACIELESAVEALERLSAADWSELGPEDVARAWPEAKPLPCETSSLTGIAAAAAGIERCCNTCGTCGGPVFHPEGSTEKGLRAIHVSFCRRSDGEALSDLKRLVDVSARQDLETSHEHGWSLAEGAERIYNGYRWRSRNGTFILEADLVRVEERSYGFFDLTRCSEVEAVEEWALDDGTVLKVIEVEARESREKERRELWFTYLSHCLLRDFECLELEWDQLWPRLRSVAEREQASRVFLSADDCNRGSVGVSPRQNPEGRWILPW